MFIKRILREKSLISWSIVAAIIIISIIYIHIATTLLRTNSDNIVFLEKELKGLGEYEETMSEYFKLPPEEQKKSGKALRNLIREIGDGSNLILDPSLESYHIINILLNHIPKFISVETASSDNLIYYFEDMEHAVHILSENNLNFNEIKDYVEQLKSKEINRQDSLLKVQELFKLSVSLLKQLLQKRLNIQNEQHSLSLAIITGLYFALIFSVVFAIRNYATKQEIKSAAEKHDLLVKLAEKNDELEKFTYAAAHDLREPIRTICCFTSLLKKEAGGKLDKSTTEYTDIIERTAKRAEQMIGDLLDYARLSENNWSLEGCDCAGEITGALEDLKSLVKIAKPNIIIGEMPTIKTIPSLFRRIILNLIDNAIKYRKDGTSPEIHIEAQKRNGDWLFSISDNGIGISSEHIDSVFQPFKRLYPSEYKIGEGIGLTSCKKIAEILGGKIWIESKIGVGTTVYFVIPAK